MKYIMIEKGRYKELLKIKASYNPKKEKENYNSSIYL